METLHLQLKI